MSTDYSCFQIKATVESPMIDCTRGDRDGQFGPHISLLPLCSDNGIIISFGILWGMLVISEILGKY